MSDPHYHDCPYTSADGKRCDGKAAIPGKDTQGRSVYKCTRCGQVASDDQLRRASLARMRTND